jgi:sulfur carrier protein ThiS adenylyltransferase
MDVCNIKVLSMDSFDDVVKSYFSPAQMSRIQNVRIGLAGCGGLGSNCAAALVRCGFCNFVLVDFDTIEPSNLNRQFFFSHQIGKPKVACLSENLRAINPDVAIDMVQKKIDSSNVGQIFDGCDVIVEAFDKADDKMLVVRACVSSASLLVCASGIAGYGDSDRIKVRKVRENFFLIGDEVSAIGADRRPLAPCVAIAAAKQADTVLTWVLNDMQ